MGFFSWLGSAIDTVASAVSSVAEKAFAAAKSIGSAIIRTTKSTIDYLAKKAENWEKILVATVKGAVSGGIKGAAGGWIGALSGALKGGLTAGATEYSKQFMTSISDSETATRADHSSISETVASDGERIATVIQNFLPTLQRKFASKAPIESFEEYLRIDVAMAFIRDLVSKLTQLGSETTFSQEDRRFIDLIDQLVMNASMAEADLQEFDAQVKQRYKKSLLLMGSERLFALWTNEEEVCKERLNVDRNDLSRTEIRFKELESRTRYNIPLSSEEQAEFTGLAQRLASAQASYAQSRAYLNNLRLITGVSEGLLQQAEADNAGTRVRESARRRNDQAGAILVNLERDLDSIKESGQLPLDSSQQEFLNAYVDEFMPEAVSRKKVLANEYVEVTV